MADQLTKDVLGIVPGVMAVGLLAHTARLSINAFPKQTMRPMRMNSRPIRPFNSKIKSPSVKPFVKGAVGIFIGTALIGARE